MRATEFAFPKYDENPSTLLLDSVLDAPSRRCSCSKLRACRTKQPRLRSGKTENNRARWRHSLCNKYTVSETNASVNSSTRANQENGQRTPNSPSSPNDFGELRRRTRKPTRYFVPAPQDVHSTQLAQQLRSDIQERKRSRPEQQHGWKPATRKQIDIKAHAHKCFGSLRCTHYTCRGSICRLPPDGCAQW